MGLKKTPQASQADNFQSKHSSRTTATTVFFGLTKIALRYLLQLAASLLKPIKALCAI